MAGLVRRPIHLLVALVLFGVLVAIEGLVDGGFVRNTVGDVVVVIFLYALLRAVAPCSPPPAAAAVLALAFAIEAIQALDLIDRLGIQRSRLIDVVLGSTFTWGDLVAYTIGVAVALGAERGASLLRLRSASGSGDSRTC